MTIEIVLLDGTKIRSADDINTFMDETPPEPGWVYINEGEGTAKRYFNPANVAYVVEVEENDEFVFEVS